MKNGCFRLLILLGIVGLPVALFVVVMFQAESRLGWSEPAAMLAGICSLTVPFALFLGWIIWQQKKEEEIVGELVDPVFGTVRQTRGSWAAEVLFPPLNETFLVSGIDGNIPTDIQRSIFTHFQEGLSERSSEIDDTLDKIDYLVIPPRPRRLKFDSLLLAPDESWCSLVFDVEDSSAIWGFSADYLDGELQELSVLH